MQNFYLIVDVVGWTDNAQILEGAEIAAGSASFFVVLDNDRSADVVDRGGILQV